MGGTPRTGPCTPPQPPLARRSRDDAGLCLPRPGPRLPPLLCWVPAALTHWPPELDCGASPDPRGRSILAPSAACCVMNKRLVTHQLEDRPCVPMASEGGREERGPSAPVSTSDQPPGVGSQTAEQRSGVGRGLSQGPSGGRTASCVHVPAASPDRDALFRTTKKSFTETQHR